MSPPLDLQIRIGSSRDDVGFVHQPQDAMLPRALRSGFSFLFLVFPLLNIFLISCGGLVSSGPLPPVIVTVSPASAQPFAGTTVQFTAAVQNAGSFAVNWQVNGMANGDITTVGSISVSGLYTAPNSVPTPRATVTVIAVLQSDASKTGSSNVTIQPLSVIQGQLSLSPTLSSVTTSQTLQLEVKSDGLRNDQVNWAVDSVPNGNTTTGRITSGLYTPPNLAGSHTITATLPNASGSAQLVVTDFAGTFTWRNDNSRSGQNQQEFALAPAKVTSYTFGRLFSCLLDGNAYAQPLYVANLAMLNKGTHNVVLVATENDSVFAFDADANANPCVPLWQTSLIPVGEEAVRTPELEGGITSNDISPFIGITGTPAIDPSSSTFLLYVVAKTESIPTITNFNPVYHQRLFALALTTGRPVQPTGIEIPVIRGFSPHFENQRAALLVDNGTVYIAFGSHRDAARISAISRTTNVVTVTTSTTSGVQVGANVTIAGVTDTSFNGTFPVVTQTDSTHFTYLQIAADASSSGGAATPASAQVNYHGWLFGYDASTLQQTMVFDVTPTGIQGGIWQSGGGPSADINHNVFVSTGNGTFDVPLGAMDYGDSFLRLNTAGALSVADYFSPCDQETMFTTGQDLGSSAPVLLPESAGSVLQPHLMMGGSKNGSLYVLNRDDLGKYNNTCPDLAPRVQVVPIGDAPIPPILSTPLFWNNVVYVAGENDKLKAFPMSGGILSQSPLASQSPETLGPLGATPVVSSNGTNNAIIWLIDTSGALATPNSPAILRAFDASDLSKEIYNSAMVPNNRDTAGPALKFTVPTVANGKVYVGTQTELDVYGLLP